MPLVAALDTSVVVAGIGWRGGDSRQVLRLLARRAFLSVCTAELVEEWTASVAHVAAEEKRWRNPNWAGWLLWLKRVSRVNTAVPLKRTVKRDPSDDVVLAAAVAGHASYLITLDPDLLTLQKPFGVRCVTPRAFLSAVLRGV
ncbi:MAG TPA: putative toxin-antitoxin system toxin component, PIN family [Verrucomicrobiae bacterium]|jgi:putative PIN family toxin of toxin-antitoxin system